MKSEAEGLKPAFFPDLSKWKKLSFRKVYEKTSLELIFFVISDKERSLLFSNTSKYNMMLNVFKKKKIEEEEG